MTQATPDAVDVEAPAQQQEPAAPLHTLYQRDGEDARRRAARVGLWVGVIVYVLYSVTDVILIPDVAYYTVIARCAVSAVMLLIMEVQYRKNVATIWLDRTCALALV